MRTYATILIAVSACVVGGADDSPLRTREVSRLELRDRAIVLADAVTLADVVDLSQADPRLAEALRDVPLPMDVAPPTETSISHERVRTLLAKHGVNFAWVLFEGANACELRWAKPKPAAGAPEREPGAPLFVANQDALPTESLADALRAFIAEEWADEGGTPEVAFEVAAQPFLELTRPEYTFSIRSRNKNKLGLREFRVTIRRGGRIKHNASIAANVRLVRRVLVADKALNVGTRVRRDRLRFATTTFERDEELGFASAEQVVGQQVKRFVPAGEMISAADLEAVDLVERSQAVTVRSTGQLNVRLVGTALDNGGYGDRIRVRLGTDRRKRRVVTGVIEGVGVVRIDPAAL